MIVLGCIAARFADDGAPRRREEEVERRESLY
jgi:hypothetical protein